MIEFAKKKNIQAVWGTDHKVSVKPFEKIEYPKTEEFIQLLKEKGVYEDLVTLNYSKFLSKINKRKIDVEILEQIKREQDLRVSLSKRREG